MLESDEVQNKIISDLNEREMSVSGFITIDKNDKIRVVSYDKKGLLHFISEEADEIIINKKLKSNLVRPIAKIG